jgi:hypothetical protein
MLELDTFYLLRYPRRNEAAIEIGSSHLQPLEALVNCSYKEGWSSSHEEKD